MTLNEEAVFKSQNYAVEITADQSPTLRPDNKESMHHMGGAASESVYLYYEALKRYFALNSPDSDVRVLSFGFGMGYNEMLTAIYFLNSKIDNSKLILVSKEKDIFLYELFNQWLIDQDKTGSVSVFDNVFLGIARALSEASINVSIDQVKAFLITLSRQGRWFQEGAVMTINDFSNRFDVVFYDAFSAKLNEYLWSEMFLAEFFNKKLSPNFVFSTYACTAVLKRVAASSGSHFDKREGFMGKRNSSIIHR